MVCAIFMHAQKYWQGLNALQQGIRVMFVQLARAFLNCELIMALDIVFITQCADAS